MLWIVILWVANNPGGRNHTPVWYPGALYSRVDTNCKVPIFVRGWLCKEWLLICPGDPLWRHRKVWNNLPPLGSGLIYMYVYVPNWHTFLVLPCPINLSFFIKGKKHECRWIVNSMWCPKKVSTSTYLVSVHYESSAFLALREPPLPAVLFEVRSIVLQEPSPAPFWYPGTVQ